MYGIQILGIRSRGNHRNNVKLIISTDVSKQMRPQLSTASFERVKTVILFANERKTLHSGLVCITIFLFIKIFTTNCFNASSVALLNSMKSNYKMIPRRVTTNVTRLQATSRQVWIKPE